MAGCAPSSADADWIARQADEEVLNARQTADRIKGVQSAGIDPQYSEGVDDSGMDACVVYCDGGTKIPRQPALSYGGFGTGAPHGIGGWN